MYGTIIDYAYKPARTQTVQGQRPKNSTAGGNGIWLTKQQVQIVLLVKDENNEIHQIDIAPEVRKIYGRKGEHVTKDKALELCKRLKNIGRVKLSEDGKSIPEIHDLVV